MTTRRYVLRREAPEAEPIPFPTLFDAACEPPWSLDARIVDGDGATLAEATRDAWVFTVPGRQRLCREVYGGRVAS